MILDHIIILQILCSLLKNCIIHNCALKLIGLLCPKLILTSISLKFGLFLLDMDTRGCLKGRFPFVHNEFLNLETVF